MNFLTANAQSKNAIKGKVMTPKGISPAGNVIALSRHDSAFIKGAAFYDGSFELSDLPVNEILLKLTSLEFRDTIIVVTLNGNAVVDLGKIVVNASSGKVLGQVVVSGRRPVYTHRNDGTLEITIENTTLSASSTVNELLTKSPEIVVNEDGDLAVMGKGRAIFYLNGKRITNSQLSMIMPGNIKKVEIIRNPSAKYDAEGAAVINITTITQRDDGYQVTARQNVTYSDFAGLISYSGLNGNYKKGKLTLNGNYALQVGKEKERLHTTRDRNAQNVFLNTDLTTDWNRNFKNYNYYGLGAQYDINSAGYVSLEYSGAAENLGGNTVSSNRIVDDSGPSIYKSDAKINEQYKNNSLSLNYRTKLDTLGSSVFIGGQYANFDNGADNLIDQVGIKDAVTTSQVLSQLQDLDVNVLAGQIDVTKAFRNNDMLEFGTRFSKVNNDFDLDFLVSADGINYTLDPERSNKFGYRESIGAAYLSFKSSLSKKLDYTIGVRGEYTDYNLQLLGLNKQEIKNDYFNILPNLVANMRFSKKINLNFSYTSRINRPPYQRLNPVLIYQDPYTSVQGNPNLIPEKLHAFELGSKIGQTAVKVGYNYTKDPLGQTALRGADLRSYILKRINYDSRYEFFVSATRTFNVKFWTSTNTVTLKYTNITDNAFEFERIEPRPNFYYYTNNRFDLSRSYSAEVMFWYLGNNREGLYDRNHMYNLTVTLGRSFFNNALKCNLIANDIFHSIVQSGDYFVGQTDVYYNRVSSTNYFRLAVSYNFGKLKKVDYKNKAIGSSESNRVN